MINKDLINTLRALIEENKRITVAEIERYFRDVACNPLLHKIVVQIFGIPLGMRKNYAKLVLKLLDDKHQW